MSDLSPLAYQSGFGNEFATEALGSLSIIAIGSIRHSTT
jgi:hypothetical protein